jgi:hypothetical protein
MWITRDPMLFVRRLLGGVVAVPIGYEFHQLPQGTMLRL